MAVHVPGFDPVHTPAWHVYVRHMFEPLQAVPSGALGFEQTPVVESHVPAM
jgi:hypothetical protein